MCLKNLLHCVHLTNTYVTPKQSWDFFCVLFFIAKIVTFFCDFIAGHSFSDTLSEGKNIYCVCQYCISSKKSNEIDMNGFS